MLEVQSVGRVNNNTYLVSLKSFPLLNLVLEGGGPKGLVYVGAIRTIESNNLIYEIENVAGSSAGAITALMLAIGYNSYQIENIVRGLDFSKFTDVSDKECEEGFIDTLSSVPAYLHKIFHALENLLKPDAKHGSGIFLGNALEKKFQEIIKNKLSSILLWAHSVLYLAEKDPKGAQIRMLSRLFENIGVENIQEAYTVSRGSQYLTNKVQSLEVIFEDFGRNLRNRAKELQNLIMSKGGKITFSDLHKLKLSFPEYNIRNLAITGVNFTDHRLEVFDVHENPDMELSLATRISMSLPWFFSSVKYKGKEYIDGGVLSNYPMHIFDSARYLNPNNILARNPNGANIQTLGLKVDSQEEIYNLLFNKSYSAGGRTFSSRLIDFIIGINLNSEDREVYERYSHRSVQIADQGYSTFNFRLTSRDKDILIEAGRRDTQRYLDLYYLKTVYPLYISKMEDMRAFMSDEEYKEFIKKFSYVFET